MYQQIGHPEKVMTIQEPGNKHNHYAVALPPHFRVRASHKFSELDHSFIVVIVCVSASVLQVPMSSGKAQGLEFR